MNHKEYILKYNFLKGHYNKEYLGDEMGRLYSYRLQVLYALKSKPQTALLVGKGDDIVGNILRNYGVKVATLDIKKDIIPNLIGSVNEIPLKNKLFDVSICCQVLEHIPFELFRASLRELKRITRGYLVLSLPDIRRFMSLRIHLRDSNSIGSLVFLNYDFCKSNLPVLKRVVTIGRLDIKIKILIRLKG